MERGGGGRGREGEEEGWGGGRDGDEGGERWSVAGRCCVLDLSGFISGAGFRRDA